MIFTSFSWEDQAISHIIFSEISIYRFYFGAPVVCFGNLFYLEPHTGKIQSSHHCVLSRCAFLTKIYCRKRPNSFMNLWKTANNVAISARLNLCKGIKWKEGMDYRDTRRAFNRHDMTRVESGWLK